MLLVGVDGNASCACLEVAGGMQRLKKGHLAEFAEEWFCQVQLAAQLLLCHCAELAGCLANKAQALSEAV